jgi:arginyl-tRNA synthetase
VDPIAAFRSDFKAAVDTVLQDWGVEAEVYVEEPPSADMGDGGIPCFSLAKELRKSPAAIAKEIAEAAKAGGWVASIHAVGPYVNATMDRHRLATEVLASPTDSLRASPKPGHVLLEHTSANPNGPLHIGRARNPIVGDTIGRILRAAGHDVESQYYMDNLGRQVALLYWGKKHIPESDLPAMDPARAGKADHELVRYYQAANERMEKDPVVAAEIKELVARLETAPVDLLKEVRVVYEACFEGMRQSLERLGVFHDSIKDESDLVEAGEVDDSIARLKKSPRAAVEDDGANYLDMEAELSGNKSTKFFFTRKDQTSVYATRDVAYHKWKAEQVGNDGYLVNVLGEDHRLQSLQVSVALEELGHRRPHVIFYAFVGLPDGKMSTRANRVVFVDDLLDEAHERAYAAVKERRGDELDENQLRAIAEQVGIAAIRFNIARVQAEKPIQFRWEEALDFESGAPYMMYAHARAASLLRKAADAGIEPRFDPALVGPGEEALALCLAKFIPTVESAAKADAPHRFCNYLLELASAFNDYYRDHHVVAAEDPRVQQMRAWCVDVARQALAKGLDAVGIPAPDAM